MLVETEVFDMAKKCTRAVIYLGTGLEPRCCRLGLKHLFVAQLFRYV